MVNIVSPSNQVTVIVSTTNKHVHISFYGTAIGFARTRVSAKTNYVQTLCYLCGFCADFVPILSVDCTLI